MRGDYLIINKRVLPDFYEKVVQVRELIREGAVSDVSEAARMVGISRSTYYKYKDSVFMPSDDGACRKAVFSFMLRHEKGVLSRVINELSALSANILTVMQTPPIGDRANVVISVDITAMDEGMERVVERLLSVNGVMKAGLMDIE